ncbi:MAG TPA: GNAT family N-acetyltransferase [Nitrococcus sp.]|nr:GNAT family N-acetyltransferase [Nitrococcus sp.]
MKLKILPSLEEIPAPEWNSLEGTDNPFLTHEFLAALEHHGAVSRRTGWIPNHLVLYDEHGVAAASPAYQKLHSWGEFVFDFAWANAYDRYGMEYYPKLVCAVPYTPATGPRVLVRSGLNRTAVVSKLAAEAQALIRHQALSSAHWLFVEPSTARTLATTGYSIRLGYQYHWSNTGYDSFEAFLAELSSKKRKSIRRERRRVREAGVEFRTHTGHEISAELWRAFHRFYVNTFHAHGNIPLLSLGFFRELGERLGSRVVLVEARQHGQTIAAALYLRSPTTLYGRYWGNDGGMHDGLHFETCYYQGIDYCIREGLRCFESGAQGEHKVARGFLPTPTYSCHHLLDQRFRHAVDDFLRREREDVKDYIRQRTREGPFRLDALERIAAFD